MNERKVVSIVIPTYNEEKNIPLIYERVLRVFKETLTDYDYRMLFVDNCSHDSSRSLIRNLAAKDNKVQYIFYVRNFGFSKSTFYGLTQADGDCAILIFADMQDPPEMIIPFVREWENGEKVVAGIKNKSKENPVMYFIRKCYYKLINKITDIDHISQFTGFGLYDRTVLDTFAKIDDPLPYLRGMVAELAPKCKKVEYEQERRKYGKSSFHFNNLYDTAMLGITSYSRTFMRFATIGGTIIVLVSLIIAIITFILKIFHIVDYPIGSAATLIGVYFLGGVLLFVTGLLGEYVENINVRSMRHPIVVEQERWNLPEKNQSNSVDYPGKEI